jgi:hypothetical protein
MRLLLLLLCALYPQSSKLCLVDLAGSERVAKTRSEGLLLREAGAINKSLALLEQVCLPQNCMLGSCRCRGLSGGGETSWQDQSYTSFTSPPIAFRVAELLMVVCGRGCGRLGLSTRAWRC